MRRYLPALALSFVACASTGAAAYRQEIGIASDVDAYNLSMRIVNRFLYEVLAEETAPNVLRIETHWRSRPPFDDEAELGVIAAETRLVIDGRTRGFASVEDPRPNYALRLSVDNRVRLEDGGDWNETVTTDMFHTYAEEIAGDFQQEVRDIGVRR